MNKAERETYGAAYEAFESRYLPPRDPEAAKAYWRERLCLTSC